MSNLDDLLTLQQAQQHRRAPAKGLPRVLEKKAKQKTQEAIEEAFRAGVFKRDHGRSRASGKLLSRSALDWDQRADVHHVLKRSTNPEGKWDIARGILLSRTEHKLAETRCPNAPAHMMLSIDGPEDLGEPQLFVTRDVHGTILKRWHG